MVALQRRNHAFLHGLRRETISLRVTLRQIAEATGYSNESVSGVLGSRAHLFSVETRERIRAAARELGYRPNHAARATRSGKFLNVGVLHATDVKHDPMPASLLTAVAIELDRRGYHLSFASWDSRSLNDPEAGPRLLREAMCDGMLIHHAHEATPAIEAAVRGSTLPVVWLNVNRRHDCVRPDDETAGRDAARCLLDAGHRRLAYVCASYDKDGRHYSADDRRRGFEAQAHAAGLEPWIIDGTRVPRDQWMQAALGWLGNIDPRPTAIACYGGEAVGLLHAAERMGLRVPDDLSILAFGPWKRGYIDTFLTGPRIDDDAIAAAAADMLVGKIENPAAGPVTPAPCVRVPMPMHIGGSVAPPHTP